MAAFPEDLREYRYFSWEGFIEMPLERRKEIALLHPRPSASCRLFNLIAASEGLFCSYCSFSSCPYSSSPLTEHADLEPADPESAYPEPEYPSGHITEGEVTPARSSNPPTPPAPESNPPTPPLEGVNMPQTRTNRTKTDEGNTIMHYLNMLKYAVRRTHLLVHDVRRRQFSFRLWRRVVHTRWYPAKDVFEVRDLYISMRILDDNVNRFIREVPPHAECTRFPPGSTPPSGLYPEYEK